MLKPLLLLSLLSTAAIGPAQKCDLSAYTPTPGVRVDATSDGVTIEWTGEANQQLRAQFALRNNRPVVTELQRRLDNGPAMAAYLGLDPGGSAGELLDASWYEHTPQDNGQRSNWRVWRPRRVMPREPDPAGPSCKLYVSPAVHELKKAIGAVASSLATARGLRAFKVGADVRGICRPDKLIIYFDRLEDLKTGADILLEQLAGCPAHGVPFTAEISPDGLLSWGADPSPRSFADRVDGMSWRMWVTQRLAEYLTAAGQAERGTLEPWQFALERLRLSGIDTDTWVPASGMWAQAFATS